MEAEKETVYNGDLQKMEQEGQIAPNDNFLPRGSFCYMQKWWRVYPAKWNRLDTKGHEACLLPNALSAAGETTIWVEAFGRACM